jgi:hypothetical protein
MMSQIPKPFCRYVCFWPEGEVLARPLFGRFRGQSGRARNKRKMTRMTESDSSPDRRCSAI